MMGALRQQHLWIIAVFVASERQSIWGLNTRTESAPKMKSFSSASVWIQEPLRFTASLLMASGGDVAHCHASHGAICLWSACSAHWCELHQASTGERIETKTLLTPFTKNMSSICFSSYSSFGLWTQQRFWASEFLILRTALFMSSD